MQHPPARYRVRWSSAKPKSAWQIETGASTMPLTFNYSVRPNPNLPGRLKHFINRKLLFLKISSSAKPKSAWQIETRDYHFQPSDHFSVRPNPNLPGRLKPRAGAAREYAHPSSAKPKSAWQIETCSCSSTPAPAPPFGQTQICLAD